MNSGGTVKHSMQYREITAFDEKLFTAIVRMKSASVIKGKNIGKR